MTSARDDDSLADVVEGCKLLAAGWLWLGEMPISTADAGRFLAEALGVEPTSLRLEEM